jgi:predicted DNA-binding transcriptional regulator AlpA
MDERLIDIRVLAEQTAIPASWWYQKAEAGLVPHLKCGRYLRFRPSEITAWLEAQRRGPEVGAR